MSKNGVGILQRGCVTRTTFDAAQRYAALLIGKKCDNDRYECQEYGTVLWIDTNHTEQSFQQTCLRVIEKSGHLLKYGENRFFKPFWFTPVDREKRLSELRRLVEAYNPSLVIMDSHDARSFEVESLRQIAAANNCHVTMIQEEQTQKK